MKRKFVILLSISLCFFWSCQFNVNKKDNENEDSLSIEEVKMEIDRSAKSVFYNMFLPCEMVYIFDQTGISFRADLLNPVENERRYSTINKRALNLGIYGVDLGYLKIHDQFQLMKNYSMAINKTSNELGIPYEDVAYAMKFLDENVSSIDSVYAMTCQLFEITDSYLNSNERGGSSSLIILGGWVEAMYITSHLVNDTAINKDIMNRIGRQKYSLNSLIPLLTLYEDQGLITNYLVMLKSLRKVFDEVELYYNENTQVTIDTSRKVIPTENAEVRITQEQFIKIRNLITKIRMHMID